MFMRLAKPIRFPFFLVSSSPFRRQASNADPRAPPSSSNDCDSVTSERYLRGCTSHLQCAKCAVDICLTSQIISKGFTGRHGRAYLVAPSPYPCSQKRLALGLPNTKTDDPSQRQLVTGIHTVSDVRCSFCGSMLGWKYDGAEEESQRYKIGKYILETKMVCSSTAWEQEDEEPLRINTQASNIVSIRARNASNVQFDSEDEEECEDLFAGVWSPNLAMKRRQARNFRNVMLDLEPCQGLEAC